MCANSLQSCLIFVALWTVACQAPLVSRQESQSGLPCPPPGDIPYPGIKPLSLMSAALTNGLFTTSTTWKSQFNMTNLIKRGNLERKMHKQRIPGEHEVGHLEVKERDLE